MVQCEITCRNKYTCVRNLQQNPLWRRNAGSIGVDADQQSLKIARRSAERAMRSG
jgi:hypothetical protein